MLKAAPNPCEVQDLQFKLRCRLKIFENNSESSFPYPCNLIACASRFGLIFTGTNTPSLQVLQINDIQEYSKPDVDKPDYPRRPIPLPSPASHLSVNCDHTILAVILEIDACPWAHFYDVKSFYTANPVKLAEARLSATAGVRVAEANWNTFFGAVFTACKTDGTLGVYELKSPGLEITELPATAAATCFCWSPKGKQIAVGSRDGKITQYKPDLKAVRVTNPPPLDAPNSVKALQWVSNYQFIAVFQALAAGGPACVVVVDAPKVGEVTYTNYEDVCYSNGVARPAQFYTALIPAWNVLLVASANSMEVGVLGGAGEAWAQWIMGDAARAELPLGVNHQDTLPVGVALDTGCTKPLPWDEASLAPPPLLLLLSDRGVLCVFSVVNLKAGAVTVAAPPDIVHERSGLALFTIESGIVPRPVFVAPKAAIMAKSEEVVAKVPQTAAVLADLKVDLSVPSLDISAKIPELDAIDNAESERLFAMQVREEYLDLEGELKALLQEGKCVEIDLGGDKEKERLANEITQLEEFYKEVVVSCNAQSSEIHILMQHVLQSFVWYEEAKSRHAAIQDPSRRSILRAEPLDTAAEKKLADIEHANYYLESQLAQAHRALDEQWNNFQDFLKKTNKIAIPTLEVIFQTMVKHKAIMQKQSYILKELSRRMKTSAKSSIGPSLIVSLNEISLNGVQDLEREMQMLRLEPEDIRRLQYDHILKKTSSFTPTKQAKLKCLLKERIQPHITVIKPHLSSTSIPQQSKLQLSSRASPRPSEVVPRRLDFVQSTPKTPIESLQNFASKFDSNLPKSAFVPTSGASVKPRQFGTTTETGPKASIFGTTSTPSIPTTNKINLFGVAKSDSALSTPVTKLSTTTFNLTSIQPQKSTTTSSVTPPVTSKAFTFPQTSTPMFGTTPTIASSKPFSFTQTSTPSFGTTVAPVGLNLAVPKSSTVSIFGATTTSSTTFPLFSSGTFASGAVTITPAVSKSVAGTSIVSSPIVSGVANNAGTSLADVLASNTFKNVTQIVVTPQSTATISVPKPTVTVGVAAKSEPVGTTTATSVFGGKASIFGNSATSMFGTTTSQSIVTTAAEIVSTSSSFFKTSTTKSIFGTVSSSGTSTSSAPLSFGITTSPAFQTSTTTPVAVSSSGTTFGATSTPAGIFATAAATTAPTSLFGGASTPLVGTGSLFGTTSSATPPSTSIFGGTTAQKPLFSAVTTNQAPNSVFGAPAITTTPKTEPVSVFGASPAFGTTSPLSTPQTPPLFGAFSTQAPTVFGGSGDNITTTTTTQSSVFGAVPSTTSSTQAFGTGFVQKSPVFGAPAATQPSIFGSSTPSSTNSPFGSATTTTASIFGATAPFGASSTPAFGVSSGTSLFGGGTTTTSTPSSTFGGAGTAAFGQTPAFGANTNTAFKSGVFGGSTTGFGGASGGSIFGATPTTSTTTSSSGIFGAGAPTSATGSGFGSSTFGGAPAFGGAGSVFGAAQPTQSAAFGAPATTQSFGFGGLNVGATSPAFGTAPAAAPANPFGAASAPKSSFDSKSIFGGATGTQSIFGASNQAAFSATPSGFGGGAFGGQQGGGGGGGGAAAFGGTTFGGGAFSAGASAGSVAQSGFVAAGGGGGGSPGGFQKGGSAFGAAPVFGGSPSAGGFGGGGASFGGAPAFGSAPAFGGTPQKVFGGGSVGGAVVGGGGGGGGGGAFGGMASPAAGFGNLANQPTVGFGNLAQQTAATPPPATSFSGGSSFSSWR